MSHQNQKLRKTIPTPKKCLNSCIKTNYESIYDLEKKWTRSAFPTEENWIQRKLTQTDAKICCVTSLSKVVLKNNLMEVVVMWCSDEKVIGCSTNNQSGFYEASDAKRPSRSGHAETSTRRGAKRRMSYVLALVMMTTKQTKFVTGGVAPPLDPT
jgi:hypothetical protein